MNPHFYHGMVGIRGANDVSRVRVQLSSSRVVNISSQTYSSRVLIKSSPSSSRVVSFY